MDKQSLRQTMRRQNRALTCEERQPASARIFSQVEQHEAFAAARCIACYCALGDEPESLPALQRWSQSGRRVVVPRVEGDEMQFYDWSPSTQRIGSFGIDEPTHEARWCAPSEIDLMVVPGVAFTRDGMRLGRGKGYYDRYLSQPEFRARTIGVGYRHQLLEELPMEPHDKMLDWVIVG